MSQESSFLVPGSGGSSYPHSLSSLASLQQSLLRLLLAGDTVLCPRHSFQPLLLQFLLAIRTHAVLIGLDTLQRRIDHIQDGAVRIGHPKKELLRIGVRRLVRQVHRRIFVRCAAFFLCARDRLCQLFPPRQQFLLVILEPFLVHTCLDLVCAQTFATTTKCPAPQCAFRDHLKTP